MEKNWGTAFCLLVYGPFGCNNMHLDICPRPARKRTNVPPQKRVYCPNIYAVVESVNIHGMSIPVCH